MDALDCPDGAAMTPVRSVSTTPAQAFALLNDQFLIRQCEWIARRLEREAATPETKVQAACKLILLRSPRGGELDRAGAYVQKHGLANFCHLLINANEFLYVD